MGAGSSWNVCQPGKVEKVVLSRCKSANFKEDSCPCNGCHMHEKTVEVLPESALTALDYSLLGSAWTDAVALERRLFSPGGLVVYHTMESKGLQETALARGYEIRPRALGWGTFGEVVVARHRTTGAKRAIKSVSKARLGPQVENAREHVRQEADVLRELDHPNIVRLHEVFEDTSNLYLVMELCEGGNLFARLDSDDRPLDEMEASGVMVQVLGAVRHMHARGFVHRDLKLENLVLASELERPWIEAPLVKLVDFGLAVRQNCRTPSRLKEAAGTLEYMAPEVKAGKVAVAFADRSDMWSLGVLFYTMLTGAFPDASRSKLLPEASEAARELLSRLLLSEPELRPTAAEASRHAFFHGVRAAAHERLLQAAPSLGPALRAFAAAPRLQRLALLAVARSTDDATVSGVRHFFDAMEFECDGFASRQALDKFIKTRPSAIVPALQGLLKFFEFVDADGSGNVTWTELVAVSLTALDCGGDEPADAGEASPGVADESAGARRGRMQQDACQHAFELLSQGSGQVSGLVLGQLFAQSDTRRTSTRFPANTIGGVSGRCLADLDGMVREVDSSGAIGEQVFAELLRGRVCRRRAAGEGEEVCALPAVGGGRAARV